MDSCEKNMSDYAIVVGNAHFNSLGIARSLGEKGISVVFINSSDSFGAENSKYTLKTYHRTPEDDIEDVIDEIIEDFGGKPVLYPCSDEDAALIDGKYESLKNKVHCPGCCGKINDYMDKEEMCRLASEVGFNVPLSLTVSVDDSGKKEAEKFGLPCIFKPLKSVDGTKEDITICKTKAELSKAVEKFWCADTKYKKILIQQFVEGEKNISVDIAGYKVRGKKARVFAQIDKIREFPENCGSTTFCKVKPYSGIVSLDVIDSVLEKMDFEGIFDFDIKLVDSIPYFVEVNLRNGAVSYGYTVAGFNIPYFYFKELLCESFEETKISETIMMCERNDLEFVLRRKISIISWLKDVARTDVMAVFNRKDKIAFKNSYGNFATIVFSLIARKSV